MTDTSTVVYYAVKRVGQSAPIALFPNLPAATNYVIDNFGAHYHREREQAGVEIHLMTIRDMAILLGVLAGGRQA